jgi:hypothetical protein
VLQIIVLSQNDRAAACKELQELAFITEGKPESNVYGGEESSVQEDIGHIGSSIEGMQKYLA